MKWLASCQLLIGGGSVRVIEHGRDDYLLVSERIIELY
jgi:hypothetical protein